MFASKFWRYLTFMVPLMFVSEFVFADVTGAPSVSNTAAVLGEIGTLNVGAILALLAAVVVALLLAPANQAAIETLVAGLLPVWAFPIKGLIPVAFSGILGKIAFSLGVSPIDAIAGAGALASGTHWVNEQTWAANLEGKYPKIWNMFKAGAAAKAAVLLLGFLALGAVCLHADVISASNYKSEHRAKNLNLMGVSTSLTPVTATVTGFLMEPSVEFGTTNYGFNNLGTIVPADTMLSGVQMGVYEGTYSESSAGTLQFVPTWVFIPAAFALDSGSGSEKLNYGIGLGYVLPSGSPFVVMLSWDLGTGQKTPFLGFVTSISLGPLVSGLDYLFGTAASFPGATW